MTKPAPKKKPRAVASPADIRALVPSFIERALAYGKAAGLKDSTLGLALFNDGKRIPQLIDGGDMKTEQLAAAEERLAEKLEELAARKGPVK